MYRIGKKNFIKARSTTKKIVLSMDTRLLKINDKYFVKCECGGERHVKKMELDLLRIGGAPRFDCFNCNCRHYNIIDSDGLLNEGEKKVLIKKQRVNKELRNIISKSMLTVDEIVAKYGVSYQGVMSVFRKKRKSK